MTVSQYHCGDCGKLVEARTYHPYVACVIFKATGKDPLPYLQDVGRFYQDHPEELPVTPSSKKGRAA